jgi:PQQ-like domain/Kelch motif
VAVLVIALIACAGAALALNRLGGGGGGAVSSDASGSRVRSRLVAKRAKVSLPQPLSGEAVTSDGHGDIVVAGGLDAVDASLDGVFRLGPGGKLMPAGTLAAPLHDAAAATAGGRVLVLGGGAGASTDQVQALGGGGAAQSVGHLPRVRSDLAAASLGGQAYVLGGYDGHSLDPSVLATGDGSGFRTIGQLAVAVRYPAVAAAAGRIYAFGGQRSGGAPTRAIQAVDPTGGRAKVVGHLPHALSHASAVALQGRVYVLGGDRGGGATRDILEFDPASERIHRVGRLPFAVSNAAAATSGGAAYLIGGIGAGGGPLSSVITLRLASVTVTRPAPTVAAGEPAFHGELLIADRGNNRLLLVDSSKRVLWRYPSKGRPAPKGGFYFPDDAFFIHHGRAIITNEEDNDTIVELGYPSGKVLFTYGHPRQPGSAPGYLSQPDDAYLLKNGQITVADAQNCRVLFIGRGGHPKGQIGTNGSCVHDPPRSIAYPNGDTPLANGRFLLSEVTGSYIDEVTASGKVIWSRHLPIAYPSDPQQLGPNRYLVADYHRPGGIYEFNRKGKILWSYHPRSGSGMLDHPSLAERLPSGLIAVNDDYRHRVAIIDPATNRIVWQYGRTDHAGRGRDRLRIPDGFDLLQAGGVIPTHPFTG